MQANMEDARDLFRDGKRTEFIIVTIPTVMAARESARLAGSLREEGLSVKTLLVNQVMLLPTLISISAPVHSKSQTDGADGDGDAW